MARRIMSFHTRKYSDAVNYRPQSIAIFNAHTVQLTTAQKILIDTQVGLLIDDGTSWAAADVIVFPMLVTEQQSLINWKNPGTYDAVAVNFASTFVPKVGFPSVAANSNYLRTQYTPYVNGVGWQPANAKMIVYVKDNRQDDGRTIGGTSNGNSLIRQRDTANLFIGRINGGDVSVSNSNGDGLFSISTSDGVNIVHKRNNTVLATTAATFNGSRTNAELLVYCWNTAAAPTVTPASFIDSNTIQCYAFGGSAMNDATFKTVRDNLSANL